MADLSNIYSKLGSKVVTLTTEVTNKLNTDDKSYPSTTLQPPSPDLLLGKPTLTSGKQTLTSVTSHTEGDGLVTETSYDLGSLDTTPSRELEIMEDVGGGVKLSLWLQWTLPKCELRLYCQGK